MDKLQQLLEKKKKEGKQLDPMEKASKMSMLQSLMDEMSGMMKDDLQAGKMKKVEVSSPDDEGLKMGLDKAKEMLGKEDEESPEHEASESSEEELSEHSGDEEKSLMDSYHSNPSKENLEKLLAHLESKKAMMA